MGDRSVMQRLLDAAGWDAGSLRHKQLEAALDGARLGIVDLAQGAQMPGLAQQLFDELSPLMDKHLYHSHPTASDNLREWLWDNKAGLLIALRAPEAADAGAVVGEPLPGEAEVNEWIASLPDGTPQACIEIVDAMVAAWVDPGNDQDVEDRPRPFEAAFRSDCWRLITATLTSPTDAGMRERIKAELIKWGTTTKDQSVVYASMTEVLHAVLAACAHPSTDGKGGAS